jgi:hypothetical protein
MAPNTLTNASTAYEAADIWGSPVLKAAQYFGSSPGPLPRLLTTNVKGTATLDLSARRRLLSASETICTLLNPVQTTKATMGHNLPTKLFYYNEESSKSAYEHQGKPYDGVVTDISGNEDKYKLDHDGFQLVNQTTAVTEFLDEKNVQKNYYPEIEQLLKDVYVNKNLSHALKFQH